MSNILSSLSAVQAEAASAYQGPSLVIAGAGSGKTRVLTHRIAYMLHQGVPPYNVLALTFTNKAAKEMRERIATLVDPKIANNLWMGTFHAVFARILRVEATHIGFSSNFTIYDPTDSKSVLRGIMRNMGLDDKAYKDSTVLSRISYAKNNLITAEKYAMLAEQLSSDREWKIPYVYKIYAEYEKYCKNADAMDFDDLLLYPNLLLRGNEAILKKYRDKFKYILVDEYQDTNSAQYFIVKMLSQQHQNLCVVGDDAQSIYSFRGANIQNILNFKKDYPSAKIFKLEQNYRSTQNIVNAANSLIAKNSGQLQKTCFSAGSMGSRIAVLQCASDHEEGFRIISDLEQRKREDNCEYAEFAILYRTNAQSRIFEDALRRKSIPYKIYAGMSFYQRKEIKDLIAYLRIIVNPKDNEAFKRVVNYPKRGIGDTTIEAIELAATRMGRSMWEEILSMTPDTAGITSAAYRKIAHFLIMIDNMRMAASARSAYDMARDVAAQSGILEELRSEKNAANQAREENVEELLNSIKAYCENYEEEHGEQAKLSDYLETVSLLTDADNDSETDKNSVTLMTVHSAKGLEFGYVYVVGMEEGLFPTSNMFDAAKDIEEERRLFYVALTRAKKYAALSYAMQRMKWGKTMPCSVSRFVGELDARYLELPPDWRQSNARSASAVSSEDDGYTFPYRRPAAATAPPAGYRPLAKTITTTTISSGKISVGASVRHERFGVGKVLTIDVIDGDERATIAFPSAGTKTLILKFARLMAA